MPFIVRYPQKIKKAAIDSTSVICANDLLPTLCDIAHIKLSTNRWYQSQKKYYWANPPNWPGPLLEYGRNETAFKFPDGADHQPSTGH
ncbi:MAG: hypothetical protein R2822_15040 [Spirosomataceae bacterium]